MFHIYSGGTALLPSASDDKRVSVNGWGSDAD